VINTSTRYPALTRPWLERWNIPYHLIIQTNDKSSVAFNWHIDDNPATLLALAAAGRRVIRWALPWNTHLVQYPAVCNWAEAEGVLR
jgi:hypothetical protein